MKKIFLFCLLIILVSSCHKEDHSQDNKEEDHKENVNPPGGVGFQGLMSKAEFEALFPYRADLTLSKNGPEFYSYQSLIDALDQLNNVKIEIYKRRNPDQTLIDYTYKMKRTDLSTNKTSELKIGGDYDADWNISKPEILVSTVRFSDFLNSGDINKDKKELCAFLANISHETTGGSSTDTVKDKGLYFKEEVGCVSGCPGYTKEDDKDFPPTSGKYYHGRGPIQLSWNYNYGPASFIMYGDKNILLKTPEMVIENGKNAFMTAVLFWNMPAGAKPSCHEVIHTNRGFAKTINVINGGVECGPGNQSKDPQVLDRIGFYKQYMNKLGMTVTETDTQLSCRDMEPNQFDY